MNASVVSKRLLMSEREVGMAREVLQELEGPEGFLSVDAAAGHTNPLPPELGKLIQQLLQGVASGASVTVTAIPEELTTSAAAAMLGVSRPTLMKKISEGQIQAHKVGTHTRLKAEDVMEARRQRRERERAAFDELRELLDD